MRTNCIYTEYLLSHFHSFLFFSLLILTFRKFFPACQPLIVLRVLFRILTVCYTCACTYFVSSNERNREIEKKRKREKEREGREHWNETRTRYINSFCLTIPRPYIFFYYWTFSIEWMHLAHLMMLVSNIMESAPPDRQPESIQHTDKRKISGREIHKIH